MFPTGMATIPAGTGLSGRDADGLGLELVLGRLEKRRFPPESSLFQREHISIYYESMTYGLTAGAGAGAVAAL